MNRKKTGIRRRTKYQSPYDPPRPVYIGPHWIGQPISPPPVEAGPDWIGQRIPYARPR